MIKSWRWWQQKAILGLYTGRNGRNKLILIYKLFFLQSTHSIIYTLLLLITTRFWKNLKFANNLCCCSSLDSVSVTPPSPAYKPLPNTLISAQTYQWRSAGCTPNPECHCGKLCSGGCGDIWVRRAYGRRQKGVHKSVRLLQLLFNRKENVSRKQ